ncbi:MAG: hypothetical protein RLZZ293_388 [Pseudomonadota bacterium]|jgi:glycerate dehydrogenase
MKIVFLDQSTCGGNEINFGGFAQIAPTDIYADLSDPQRIIQATIDATVIVLNKVMLDATLIMQLPSSVRLIVITATGYDNVDIQAATKRKIKVANVPSYGTDAVAQLTIAMLLNCATNLITQVNQVNSHGWDKVRGLAIPMMELSGKTLGIIGLGAIGIRVAQLAMAFGMNVIAYNRTAKIIEGVSLVSLTELAQNSDYVSLHCALNSNTKAMLDNDFFVQMKDSAYLINTARGGLINENDLVNALINKQLAGAILDVLTDEPPCSDNQLLKLSNVLITPHIAWGAREARQRCIDIAVDNIVKFKQGIGQNLLN